MGCECVLHECALNSNSRCCSTNAVPCASVPSQFVDGAPADGRNRQAQPPTAAGTPLLSPEPHLGPREPTHGDAFVEFVDE